MSQPDTLSYESHSTPLSGLALGTIALQLVGVYCFVQALPVVPLLALFFGTGGTLTSWDMLIPLIPPAIYILLGLGFIRLAPQISAWLFRNMAGVMSGPVSAETGRYLQAIAFSVVGVFVMIDATPKLVRLLGLGLIDMGSGFRPRAEMLEPVAQFVLGLVLFLQARGLALLWHRLRAGAAEGR